MKVAILAGGVGSRLAEETKIRPKPMVEIGGKPILWHIMKYYASYGHKDFAVALGYKGEFIKKWFMDYSRLSTSMTVDFTTGEILQKKDDNASPEEQIDWKVDLVDTGIPTLTGGRIKRLAPWIGNETFMLTWGDGVSNVDLDKLLAYHKSHGKLLTMTAVHPPARFGQLEIEDGRVVDFNEKPQTKEGRINGAFFVCEPGIFDYIEGDDTQFEYGPLDTLAREGQLMAYMHDDFWQCMDTLRDKVYLEKVWNQGNPPWKRW